MFEIIFKDQINLFTDDALHTAKGTRLRHDPLYKLSRYTPGQALGVPGG
jgi:hypothetical protein